MSNEGEICASRGRFFALVFRSIRSLHSNKVNSQIRHQLKPTNRLQIAKHTTFRIGQQNFSLFTENIYNIIIERPIFMETTDLFDKQKTTL